MAAAVTMHIALKCYSYCMYSKNLMQSAFVQRIALSLMVAVVQCQDCGGLGSFHDIRKNWQELLRGSSLAWGYFFYAGQPDTNCFLDYIVHLILQILFNIIPKLKPQHSQT